MVRSKGFPVVSPSPWILVPYSQSQHNPILNNLRHSLRTPVTKMSSRVINHTDVKEEGHRYARPGCRECLITFDKRSF